MLRIDQAHSRRALGLARRTLAALVLAAVAAPASAVVIGTFSAARSNSPLGTSPDYSDVRNAIVADGHTLNAGTETGSLTAAYLSTVDVFLTGVIEPFFMPAAGVVAAEAAALQTWVAAGGTLIISGEHNGFVPAFNPYAQAFGITMAGFNFNYNAGVGFVNNPSDPYLQNGVAGGSLPINNRGYIASVTNPHTVLATHGLNPGELFAISMDYGQGTVVAFADTYFMNNASDANNIGWQFLRNALNIAGQPDVDPPAVPEPTALLLLATGLAWAGRRRARG